MKKIINVKIIFTLESKKGNFFYRKGEGQTLTDAFISMCARKGNGLENNSPLKLILMEQFKDVTRFFGNGFKKLPPPTYTSREQQEVTSSVEG